MTDDRVAILVDYTPPPSEGPAPTEPVLSRLTLQDPPSCAPRCDLCPDQRASVELDSGAYCRRCLNAVARAGRDEPDYGGDAA